MTAELLDPGARRPTARRAPWTLMYHSVEGGAGADGGRRDDPYRVTVSPRRLARQLAWLTGRGLRGVSMRELLAARAAGGDRGLVGLTFDDGYEDFRTNALPLLLEGGHTATVFVLPGRLGGDNNWDARGPRKRLLDGDGIREIAAAGMEIGSHGLLHRDLTELHDVTLTSEVRGSRRRLADLTGTAPEGFCYPYGAVDVRVLAAVRAAGYGYACAVGPGPLAGPYALPRTYVGEADTGPRLHAKRWRHALRGPFLDERRPEPGPEPRPRPAPPPPDGAPPEPHGGTPQEEERQHRDQDPPPPPGDAP